MTYRIRQLVSRKWIVETVDGSFRVYESSCPCRRCRFKAAGVAEYLNSKEEIWNRRIEIEPRKGKVTHR